MGLIRDYWRDQKRREALIDKSLAPRFDHERLAGEGFSAFKKRWKKKPF